MGSGVSNPVSDSTPSSTAHSVTSDFAGALVAASATLTRTASLLSGRTSAGLPISTARRREEGETVMFAEPTARCGIHFSAGRTGRTTTAVAKTLGIWSAESGTGTSSVFVGIWNTLLVSTRSCSSVSTRVPAKGAFTRMRAVSPGAYSARSGATSTASGFSRLHGWSSHCPVETWNIRDVLALDAGSATRTRKLPVSSGVHARVPRPSCSATPAR